MGRSVAVLALLAVGAGCGGPPGETAPRIPAPLTVDAPQAHAAPTTVSAFHLPDAVVADILQRGGGVGDPGLHFRTPRERAQLGALYRAASDALWLDGTGRPTRDAEDALALLGTADAHGLRITDYQPGVLSRLADDLAAPDVSISSRVRFELALSLHVLRYWRDLHIGRVDPRALGFRLDTPVDDHDFPAMLRAAVSAHRLGAATSELVPPLVLHRSLVTALARYRTLAPHSHPLTVPARSFKPGDQVAGLGSLQALLVSVGDLATEAPPVTSRYEEPLVSAVMRFQSRHGLEADGVLGRSTLAALRVPLAVRVEQLELALERLRWLPHLHDEGFLVVNIPMFRLWGWGTVPPDGTPAFDMRVIVGRALDTETPVFTEQLRHLIFRPYWNVPPSIARGEVLPAILRDPTYLARNDMEIVAGPGDDARVVAASPEALEQLRQGRLRVRQRPGPRNSLGLVKFVFPNDDNIYMHGTPAPQLFGRARRDFSHGCVRLEDPVALAAWVLRDQPEWTRARITEAMQAPTPQRVSLLQPLQVILFYLTAIVVPDDGSVHFAEDIYGHDRTLVQALARTAMPGSSAGR